MEPSIYESVGWETKEPARVVESWVKIRVCYVDGFIISNVWFTNFNQKYKKKIFTFEFMGKHTHPPLLAIGTIFIFLISDLIL